MKKFVSQKLQHIFSRLFAPHGKGIIFSPDYQYRPETQDDILIARNLNAAFLITLTGEAHPLYRQAAGYLKKLEKQPRWKEIACFYRRGKKIIEEEIERGCNQNPDFLKRLGDLNEWLSDEINLADSDTTNEKIWSVFFPEGVGIRNNVNESVSALRRRRRVTITEANSSPISNPVRQILFTSNALLTLPLPSTPVDGLNLTADLKAKISSVMEEEQLYWYDHPVPVGIEPQKNEVLYGMQALDQAIEFERRRGNVLNGDQLTCVLSASVTHGGLQKIAGQYLSEEFAKTKGLKNIKLYLFTETNTVKLLENVLIPAARHFLNRNDAGEYLSVFGVDGEYGRHYTFLKAISALWQVFIDREIRATFKIDLDQVFPQKELVEQAGTSAFEHFRTPLWGANGLDVHGQPLDLGMIAGALVNEKDIGKGLFTPDVPFPEHALSPDEFIFFSTLPQALSTEAEMMARYDAGDADGRQTCLQRIHVTGGTNGILVDSLFQHRPFTPSFFGRAEDQAFILSDFPNPLPKLAYLHKPGLIMRHDKEAFAQEAMDAARVGKQVGDYIRILMFSAYSERLTENIDEIKEKIDPFTGCFVSRIPFTVVYLRFALKAVYFYNKNENKQGWEFIADGIPRLKKTIQFVEGDNSELVKTFRKEKTAWNLFYDTLSALNDALEKEDEIALMLRKKAKKIVKECRVNAEGASSFDVTRTQAT
ncbi:MAG: hypothetical protein ACE5GL_02365 [Calditrichia bacterium]